MFASTTSATLVGVDPRPVSVECHVGGGRESFHLVGLPDTAVREAKERVRAALAASGHRFPARRVTVSLAPATLPKAGSSFDLPIALAVLAAARRVDASATAVVASGELALDGTLRPARDVVAAALVAADLGRPCVVAADAASSVSAVPGLDLRPATSLAEAAGGMTGSVDSGSLGSVPAAAEEAEGVDLADVLGQPIARRALELAAAGGHHLLLSGPPGCGKTMLAQRLPGLLPDLSDGEALEVSCAWAAAGRTRPVGDRRPPFRAPHHSASSAALLGGGSGMPVPGEVTLADRGVLFLDELGEFPVNVLEGLRQPLEDRSVTIARKGASLRFPARCQVVAATNPCPCGERGDRTRRCRCSDAQVDRYRRRLAGPLLDRFDLRRSLARPDRLDGPPGEPTVVVRARVEAARRRQRLRGATNALLDTATLRSLPVEPAAAAVLGRALADGTVTGRGYERTMRVARTIADLDGRDTVDEPDVAEALAHRSPW
jgi:magnesium chelatase family protein